MRAQQFREDTVLDCANMLMSSQLRSLVEESLDMFATFLERHDTDEVGISLEAALELKLIVAEDGVVACMLRRATLLNYGLMGRSEFARLVDPPDYEFLDHVVSAAFGPMLDAGAQLDPLPVANVLVQETSVFGN